jgi:integrase
VKLTPQLVLSLPSGPNGTRRDYSDSVAVGLRLRVSASGDRTYAFAYRAAGKVRRFTIGDSRSLSLATARERVRQLRLEVLTKGADPQRKKIEERRRTGREGEATQFRALCDAFVRDQSPDWRPSTRLGWVHHIEKNIKPALGDKRPDEITSEDVRDLIDAMTHGVSTGTDAAGNVKWKRRPAPIGARRCFEVLRRLFAWAVWKGRVHVSPCVSARPFESRKRSGAKRASRRFKPYTDDQLRAIFAASKGTELEHVVDLVARTGVRRHEALAARWEDIDEDAALWRVPAEMHKVGDETGDPHVVALSPGALRTLILVRQKGMASDGGWLFPAATTNCYVCERAGHADPPNKVARSVKAAACIADRGLLHRFRDTIKTRMSEHGIDARVSEHILGHVVPGIEGRYNHAEMLPQRRQALKWWDQELDRILRAKEAFVGAKLA